MGTEGMFDAATARRLMVDGQVRTADVTDPELLEAMLTVPRERFVPPSLGELAYLDKDVPIANGRALLKPMVLAKLIQAAHVCSEDRVLDVACGTGYSSAVLGRLAGSVIGLEEDTELARQAKAALAAAGAARVEIAVGPLTAGWIAGAPYDVILLNGATEIVPEAFAHQLKPDGRLVCVHGRPPAAKGTIYRVIEGHLAGRPIFDAAARLLPGFAAPPAFVF
jgi:protein-L-isoaspartate(D-aspartate) O-methyltransferase